MEAPDFCENLITIYHTTHSHNPNDLVCILLGTSPASDCGLPTFRNPLSVPSSRAGCKVWSTLHPALEDETDRVFRNVGIPQSDAGEIPKRIHTRFKTRRKFEIKNPNDHSWYFNCHKNVSCVLINTASFNAYLCSQITHPLLCLTLSLKFPYFSQRKTKFFPGQCCLKYECVVPIHTAGVS